MTLLGGSGKFIRAFDPQRFDIFKECLLERRGEFRKRNLRFARPVDGFVVHVGDVHDAVHLVTAQLEMSLEQIFEDVSPEISDVRAAVNGRSASVDADLAPCRIARLKVFQLARISIKEA